MALVRTFSHEFKFNHGSVFIRNKRRLFGSCPRTMGRKRRVVLTSTHHSPTLTMPPLSRFEFLPQDILVTIMCGVDHNDLKQLFHVSKTIREAATVAKQMHFAFSTPCSVLKPFRDLEDRSNFEEAPDAPKQPRRYRSRFCSKKHEEISVALFAKMEM